MSRQLILATHSAGKLRELSALLKPMDCIAQADLAIPSIEETGLSFVENALIKARHAARYGHPALADDSGLVIPALQGQPGIYSARFAGVGASDKENMDKVLDLMKGNSDRRAYFYSVIVLLMHPEDPTPSFGFGQLHGFITESPMGRQGFGYDPIFFLKEQNATLAELAGDLKNKLSHRAKALNALLITDTMRALID